MGVSSDIDESCHRLHHVVTVLGDDFLCFTSVGRIERYILDAAFELMDNDIPTFTIYDRRGLVLRYFQKKYGNCSRRLVCCDGNQSSVAGDSEYFSCIESCNSENADKSSSTYFLEAQDSNAVISQHQLSQHGGLRGIRLCFLDQRHAHIRTFDLRGCEYKLHEEWIEARDVTFDDVCFKYRIPTDDHICQPALHRQLFTIDGVEASMPDLIVSVHVGMRDAIQFCIMFIYMKLMLLLSHFSPKLVKPRMEVRIDLQLFFRSILARVGAMCLLGKHVIYSFGPCGIPPWFLAEAELHQCFSMERYEVRRCLDSFYKCQRRNGR
ncbi:hypothetical protein X943_001857 [Babesia divergens]|uniref:Uncharacterized protein n=1 Tax=Babesia divergens TaxID=32595 RepID=A0AAD9LJ92_BABDI|nr:hypothetical protein X943_001857 [Babesia divergens]